LIRCLVLVEATLLGLLLWGTGLAEPPRPVAKRADPLVKSLETLYSKSMEVALTGDLDAYWRLRTAGSRQRPPMLNRERLPLLARMLPPLESLQFVRLDTDRSIARVLYRWPREDMIRYTVIVYRTEDGVWKIDSIVVKTDVVNNPREAVMTQELRRRAAAAAPAN
jgi:hypothetical protein